jgi:leader peptidase (prepilin peptidase)/N-methyltransferase
VQSWLLPVLAAPAIGSFLGVVIRRLPEGRPIALARSTCESCGTPLAARDLVPIGSYLLLRGRCRACGAPIGGFHLAVELAALAVAACAAAVLPNDPPLLWISCGLGWTLLTLAWIDWGHLYLPDALTLPLVPAGLLVTWWLTPWALADHAIGAALGYAAFYSLAWVYRRLRGREGLGQGDAKLLAVAGAWLGWEGLPVMVLLAALAGLSLAGALAMRHGRVDAVEPLPFGPALALAFWLCWLQAMAF